MPAKHRKFDLQPPKDGEHDATDHHQSILLQLPPEIRNAIWEEAFVGVIHPFVARRGSTYHLRYKFCREEHSDIAVYQDRKGGNGHIKFGYHADCRTKGKPMSNFLVPPVCKQLYSEALSLVLGKATFSFLANQDMEKFCGIHDSQLGLAKHVGLAFPVYYLNDEDGLWRFPMVKFHNLETLAIVVHQPLYDRLSDKPLKPFCEWASEINPPAQTKEVKIAVIFGRPGVVQADADTDRIGRLMLRSNSQTPRKRIKE